MNEDLAFCLETFADEQIVESSQEIDENLNELELEKLKLADDINIGETAICQQENNILERLSTNLKQNHTDLSKARQLIEDELHRILNYALSNLEKIAAKTTDKQLDDEIRSASNRLRRQNEQFESELAQLIDIIDHNDNRDCTNDIKIWFQQHFKYIEDLNRKINENYEFSKDDLIQHSIDRKQLWEDRIKLIGDFLKAMQIEDGNFINALIYRCKTFNDTIKLTRTYIEQRQKQRRELKEESVRQMEQMIEKKRLAQQTRTLQLAATLRQLAVGSDKEKQFNQRFENLLDQSEKLVPIVIGHIDQPTVKELPLVIRLDADFHTWSSNKASIQQEFCSDLSKNFNLPKGTIRIISVEQGSVILNTGVQPPYGQVVIDKLQRKDSKSSNNIDVIQKCCAKFKVRPYSVTLGEFGLKIKERVMDPRWNKVYVHSRGQSGGIYWKGSIDRGGKPYFCPKGWTRYGIQVAKDAAEFDAKWGAWHIAYHGTKGSNASLILATGLRTSVSGCFAVPGRSSVYLTPSIEYAAHPRYAHPWKKSNKANDDVWFQLIFQCRVNPASVGKAHPETLFKENYRQTVSIDENFSNDQLTWVIPSESATETYIRDNIICYGMMVRKSNCDPKELPPSKWWQYTYSST